jgi:hypothetical protein
MNNSNTPEKCAKITRPARIGSLVSITEKTDQTVKKEPLARMIATNARDVSSRNRPLRRQAAFTDASAPTHAMTIAKDKPPDKESGPGKQNNTSITSRHT